MQTRILLGAALAALLAVAPTVAADDPEVYGVFDGDEMYTLLPPDGIPAILDPEYVTGDEAAAQMSADETVLAMEHEGEAVCWSAWQLDHHEIVNDTLAGTAIAATW